MKHKLLAIFTLLSITLNAQITWEKLIIPDSVIRPNGIVEIDEGVLILSSGQGILKSIDNGASWYGVSTTSAMDIVFNPRNETLYTSNLISYDYGETWVQTGLGYYSDISVLSNNDIVLCSANLILKMSPDGSQVDTLYNPTETELMFCKVVEDNYGYLYTGTYAPLGGGGIYRSDDFGESWDIISWDSVFVLDLAVGPNNALYAARYGGYNEIIPGLYKSTDHGLTWEKIHDGYLSARAVLVLPDSTVFGGISSYGGSDGVYQIKPDGNMGFVNDGLIDDDVEMLYFSPEGRLYARVNSRAYGTDQLYEFYRTTEPIYVGQNDIANSEADISIFPNPAYKSFTIRNQNEKIEGVKIFNMHGQQILIEANLFNKDYKVNLNNIIPGNYIVQIFTSSGVYSEKLTVY